MNRGKDNWWFAVAAWIVVIFFSSTSTAGRWSENAFRYLTSAFRSTDPPHFDLIHLLADKSVHVGLFCMLAILLWQALYHSRAKALKIIGLGAVVGSCSEFLQRFFPDRDPAVRDVLINIGGTCLGIAVCVAIIRFSRSRAHDDRLAEQCGESQTVETSSNSFHSNS